MQIPQRIFKSNKSKRFIAPICAGKNIYNPADGTSKIAGEVLLICEDGFVKTKEPAVIDAIFNNNTIKKMFVKPIYKTENGMIVTNMDGKPVIEKFSDEPNEIFVNDAHKKAVEKAIADGSYEFITEEDLEKAIEDEKKEAKKIELLELKKKNKAKKEAISKPDLDKKN